MLGLLLKDTHNYVPTGRLTPNVDAGMVSRGEVVGIVINNRATVCRAVSSRVEMARLKWTQKSQQRSKESFLGIICAYAPLARILLETNAHNG